ncbi:TlpA family protein disulfide reductase [Hydrogenophaga sp.]|uniref:TlpA family protein disulfide reductase n=1 Tax=Hydrogenophaga sp. TaxID=1904254 RepID=UPI003567AE4B
MHLPPNRSRRHLLTALPMLALSSVGSPLLAATAQTAPLPELEGVDLNGQRVQLSSMRERVLLLFYWSTACAVCRDKLPELRANVLGWKDQPFTLLGINMDARQADFMAYEKLLALTVPAPQRFVSIWAGDRQFRENMPKPVHLPHARLLDKSGRLVSEFSGRIPSQAWDKIAELI